MDVSHAARVAQVRPPRDLARELEECVCPGAHRGGGDPHAAAGLGGRADTLRTTLDALGVGNRRAADLLDDEAHEVRLFAESRPRATVHRTRAGAGDYCFHRVAIGVQA
jgi:hypothetical protein